MATPVTTDRTIRTAPAGRPSLRDWPGWFYVPGIAFLVVGILAVAEPPLASLAAAFYVGAMLCVAGGVMFVGGIANISHHGGWIAVVLGLLSLIIGVVVLKNPAAGAVSLARLLAAWLIVGGLFELGFGFNIPLGRSWLVLVSLMNILLGAFVLVMRPGTAFAFFGYFVGVSLMFHGLWSLIFTAQLHDARRSAEI